MGIHPSGAANGRVAASGSASNAARASAAEHAAVAGSNITHTGRGLPHASNSTVVLAERSVLCATPGTELEASKNGLVTVKRGVVAVQGPGRVVAHMVPKGGRLDARSQRVVAWTLQSEAAHDAKDWRAFSGPAVVYLASAAPPAPLGRLLRMRASPSKGGLKSAAKGALRKVAFSLAAAPVVAFRRMVARAVTARVSLDNKVRFIEQTPARIRPTRCAADGAFTWHWY